MTAASNPIRTAIAGFLLLIPLIAAQPAPAQQPNANWFSIQFTNDTTRAWTNLPTFTLNTTNCLGKQIIIESKTNLTDALWTPVYSLIYTGAAQFIVEGRAEKQEFYQAHIVNPDSANVFYVSTTGSDANPGTARQPWLTVQQAANTMNPGDTVIVTAGTYPERLETARDGSPGHNITFQAQGVARINGADIANMYNVISGFEITGTTTSACAYSAAIYFRTGNHNPSHSMALGNNIHDIWCLTAQVTNNYNGIAVDGTNTVVAGNTIKNCSPVAITIAGASSVISNNWIENVPNGLYCFGTNHDICANVFTNINSPGGLGTHPDVFQSWGSCTGLYGGAHNVIFERNYAVDCAAAICQMTDDCSTNSLSDWTFRNNVFVRVADAATVEFPGAHWFNNTFYRCNQNSSAVLTFGYDPSGIRGQAWRAIVKNNAFVECGPSPDDTTRGWYSADPNLTDFVADYNYIGASNGLAKITGLLFFTEPHGINGGPPNFVNPGADFHLAAGSILTDAGTTITNFITDFDGTSRPQGAAWDIAAYEGRRPLRLIIIH